MKKLLILSGKGGTGKTTTAAAFIHFGKIKAIADCDVDAPNLHILNSFKEKPETSDYFGSDKAFIDNEKCIGCGTCFDHCRFDSIKPSSDNKYVVLESFCEGCGVCEYLCPQKAISMKQDIAGKTQLYINDRVFSTAELKMGRGNSGKLVTAVKDALTKNCNNAAISIIDGSPGIGCPVMASLNGVDLVLAVTEPTESGKSDLQRLLHTVNMCGVKSVVCVNKYDINAQISNEIKSWCEANKIPFVGTIPYDENVSRALNCGKSISETNSPAATALKNIFDIIMEMMNEI